MGGVPADLGERRGPDERADHPDRRLTGGRGTGTLSAAIGLTVVFTLLIATIQIVARLARTSTVEAVATDAVHRVAEAGAGDESLRRHDAERRIHDLLGPGAEITWSTDDGQVRVEVTVSAPSLPGLPDRIRRGAAARREGTR